MPRFGGIHFTLQVSSWTAPKNTCHCGSPPHSETLNETVIHPKYSLSLVARLLKLFKTTIHLDEWTWILHRYAVCPGERFTGALNALVAAKWQLSPRISAWPSRLISLHGSLLLFYSSTTWQFLTTRARSSASHERCCRVSVFIFPEQEFGLVSEVYQPDYSMMNTAVTRNKM